MLTRAREHLNGSLRASTAAWFDKGVVLTLVIIGAGGAALRLRQYLFNRSFWIDEAAFAASFIDRDLLALLTTPLISNQSAPPGFLISAYVSAAAFGPLDWALRFTPLLAGLLALPLAIILARRELLSPIAQIAFVGIVSLSPVLVYYSSEFKPYAVDATAALALLAAFSYRNGRLGTLVLAVVGFICLLTSLPAAFVAAPAGLMLLVSSLRTREFRKTIIVGLACLSALALHGLYLYVAGTDRQRMVWWWDNLDTFAPLPPSSTDDWLWYPKAMVELTYLTFRNFGAAIPGFHERWVDSPGIVLGAIFVTSLLVIAWRRSAILLLAASSVAVTLLAAMAQLYPFSSRPLIFLAPVVAFIVAGGVDQLPDRIRPLLGATFVVFFVYVTATPTIDVWKHPLARSDMRTAFSLIHDNYADGDAIVVGNRTKYIFDYYNHFHAIDGAPVLYIEESAKGSRDTFALLERFKRVWCVFGHGLAQAEHVIGDLRVKDVIEEDHNLARTRVLLLMSEPSGADK